jgi:DNA polymerase-3 subunit beta
MKIIVDQSTLSRALKALTRVTPTKTIIPILGMLRIVAKDENLEITANNLDVSLTLNVPANLDGEVAFLVDGMRFGALVQRMTGDVYVQVEEATIEVSSDDGLACSFATSDASEFPPPLSVTNGERLAIPFNHFEDAVTKVEHAVAENDIRPTCRGIRFATVDKMIHAFASSTVGMARIPLWEGSTKEFNIPPASARVVLTAAKDADEIEFESSDSVVVFHFPGGRVAAKLFDGQYPPVEKLLATVKPIGCVRVPLEALRGAVNQVSLMASPTAPRMVISVKENSLTLSCESPDRGTTGERKLTAKTEGAQASFALNYQYLLDVLGALRTDEIDILYQASSTAALALQNAAEPTMALDLDRDLFLIMPIRL